MDLSIERAGPGDAPALAALASLTLPSGWSAADFARALERRDGWVWIARGRGNGVGAGLERASGGLVARAVADEVEVLWLAVDPDHRRRGLGLDLVECALELARGRGARVHLELRASNEAARALYDRAGFVVAGRRPRYYGDGEDALLMTSAAATRNRPTVDSGARNDSSHGEPAAQPAPPLRLDAEVVRNTLDAARNPAQRRLVLRCEGWQGFEPGQFAMLSPGAQSSVPRWDPLLPRPMAVYRAAATDSRGAAEVEILYKLEGRGTVLLAEARPGERIRLVGPLGTPFGLPAQGELALLVGGGTGIASLYELASRAARRGPVRVLLGARAAGDLMGVADFEALGVEVAIATEDGSLGSKGLVTRLLEEALAEPAADAAPTVYACGPTPMMRACAERAEAAGATCWVSLENTMACGFGVCLGCAVPLSAGGFGLVCRQGPVFRSTEVEWEGLP